RAYGGGRRRSAAKRSRRALGYIAAQRHAWSAATAAKCLAATVDWRGHADHGVRFVAAFAAGMGDGAAAGDDGGCEHALWCARQWQSAVCLFHHHAGLAAAGVAAL